MLFVEINGKRTSGLNIMGTYLQIQFNCSGGMISRLQSFKKVEVEPDANEHQVFCLCAVMFQKYYAEDSSWDSLDENSILWDSALEDVLIQCNEGFLVTIQTV